MNDNEDGLINGPLRRALWVVTILGVATGWTTACNSDEHEDVVVEGVTIAAEPEGDSVLLTETRWTEIVDVGDALRRIRSDMQRDDDRQVAGAIKALAEELGVASTNGVDAEDSARLRARATALAEFAKDLDVGFVHDGDYVGDVFARAHSTLSRHFLARVHQHIREGQTQEAGRNLRAAVQELETGFLEATGFDAETEVGEKIADARTLADQWESGGGVTAESRELLSVLEADGRRLANGLGAHH